MKLTLVTQRHRTSPFPMLPVSEATDNILTNTPLPRVISLPVNENLIGYVLAEDVNAPESVPAFRASIVDGYAVIRISHYVHANLSIRRRRNLPSNSDLTCRRLIPTTSQTRPNIPYHDRGSRP